MKKNQIQWVDYVATGRACMSYKGGHLKVSSERKIEIKMSTSTGLATTGVGYSRTKVILAEMWNFVL